MPTAVLASNSLKWVYSTIYDWSINQFSVKNHFFSFNVLFSLFLLEKLLIFRIFPSIFTTKACILIRSLLEIFEEIMRMLLKSHIFLSSTSAPAVEWKILIISCAAFVYCVFMRNYFVHRAHKFYSYPNISTHNAHCFVVQRGNIHDSIVVLWLIWFILWDEHMNNRWTAHLNKE